MSAKPYVARVYNANLTIALGNAPGKPGTVAHWLQQQLQAHLSALGTKGKPAASCTVGSFVDYVAANGSTCPSKCAPAVGGIWAQFVAGYLRWQVRHGQVALVEAEKAAA